MLTKWPVQFSFGCWSREGGPTFRGRQAGSEMDEVLTRITGHKGQTNTTQHQGNATDDSPQTEPKTGL